MVERALLGFIGENRWQGYGDQEQEKLLSVPMANLEPQALRRGTASKNSIAEAPSTADFVRFLTFPIS